MTTHTLNANRVRAHRWLCRCLCKSYDILSFNILSKCIGCWHGRTLIHYTLKLDTKCYGSCVTFGFDARRFCVVCVPSGFSVCERSCISKLKNVHICSFVWGSERITCFDACRMESHNFSVRSSLRLSVLVLVLVLLVRTYLSVHKHAIHVVTTCMRNDLDIFGWTTNNLTGRFSGFPHRITSGLVFGGWGQRASGKRML